MSDRRLGFGLLGTGLIAPFHAKSLLASGKTKLVGVADTNPERLAKFVGEYGCIGYGSLDEMLANPEIDVVNILLPNHLHRDAALKSIAAGKHVLVEKPPAMSLKEVDEMDAAAKAAGVKLGVVLNCRMRAPIKAMKTAIEEGRFGKIYHADTYMKWFRSEEYYSMDAWRSSRRSGAGVTIQQAFHYIDLLQHLVGPVKNVYAQMTNLAHPKVELEDTVLAMVEYANGGQGIVEASTALWPGTDMRIEINGENGTAIMSGEKMVTWKFRDERPEDEAIRQLGSASKGTAAGGPADFDFADHQCVIEDMVDAIVNDHDPIVTMASARQSLEWALAMYKSAKDHASVSLPILNEEEVW